MQSQFDSFVRVSLVELELAGIRIDQDDECE
jgi:hypothetical protein